MVSVNSGSGSPRRPRSRRWQHFAGCAPRTHLSLLIVAIVLPLNVVFGVVTALALVRGRFRGRGVIEAIIDLPFAVSPVVVGVALILLWGSAGGSVASRASASGPSSDCPAGCLATLFVTLPFIVREVEPVLHEIGEEQEEASTTLGANGWQTFLAHLAAGDPMGAQLRHRADRCPLAR